MYVCHYYRTLLTNSSGIFFGSYRARVFTGSLESAIYLLSTICCIPPTVSVLPAINTNFTHHISAGLADGTQITGQNSISHPSAPTALPDVGDTPIPNNDKNNIPWQQHMQETEEHDRIEDATLPGSLPTLRKQYIDFTKAADEDLPTRIERIWYINPYGHEIRPFANPKVLDAIRTADALVYSIGSLYTSIVPSLVLRGVGAALADPAGVRYKILVLNSTVDRETGPSKAPMTATDFVLAIARAAAQTLTQNQNQNQNQNQDNSHANNEQTRLDVRRYVTHLIYLEDEGAPRVNKNELLGLGIECIRVYGRRVEGRLQYDEAALARAFEAVIGKPEVLRSRRNTSRQ